jgi:inorganic phosphate transporter, PiT family
LLVPDGTDVTGLFVVVTVIAVALVFDFTNGFHDSANAMAGPIATGAIRPRTAVFLAAILNLLGACLSTEVAKTISGGFFDETLITVPIILAGLVGATIWNLITWLLGLPSSSSHALFGGLIGAVFVGAGIASVNGWVIVSKVLLPAIVAPLVAGIAATWATRLAYRITRKRQHRQHLGLWRRARRRGPLERRSPDGFRLASNMARRLLRRWSH